MDNNEQNLDKLVVDKKRSYALKQLKSFYVRLEELGEEMKYISRKIKHYKEVLEECKMATTMSDFKLTDRGVRFVRKQLVEGLYKGDEEKIKQLKQIAGDRKNSLQDWAIGVLAEYQKQQRLQKKNDNSIST